MLLLYAVHKRDPVFIIAYLPNCVVYVRNLMLIRKQRRDNAAEPIPAPVREPQAANTIRKHRHDGERRAEPHLVAEAVAGPCRERIRRFDPHQHLDRDRVAYCRPVWPVDTFHVAPAAALTRHVTDQLLVFWCQILALLLAARLSAASRAPSASPP